MRSLMTLPLFVLAVSLATGPALAGEDLAKKNGCLACHGIDKKLVGPSFKDVAAKYKDDAGAAETLGKHVRDGSKGVWGAIAMPPQPKISDDELKAVIAWVLKQ